MSLVSDGWLPNAHPVESLSVYLVQLPKMVAVVVIKTPQPVLPLGGGTPKALAQIEIVTLSAYQ